LKGGQTVRGIISGTTMFIDPTTELGPTVQIRVQAGMKGNVRLMKKSQVRSKLRAGSITEIRTGTNRDIPEDKNRRKMNHTIIVQFQLLKGQPIGLNQPKEVLFQPKDQRTGRTGKGQTTR